eukprot:CAMPEP_0172492934 /NCGR_PEP_ID=MMETSP1066-20121228/24224_1 /TAXON_ID=671091 /ORGANISM="Coscinodiscus wailesii, Strain CCMP2513" /LENGTH=555 /DNA_ID=CAMNT_0013262823 /DNA_START=9 /DNA_END=1676 /DNA_ORIENTATION=+
MKGKMSVSRPASGLQTSCLLTLLFGQFSVVECFTVSSWKNRNGAVQMSDKSWGIGDDWSALAIDNGPDINPLSQSLVQVVQPESDLSDFEGANSVDDVFIGETIDHIYHNGAIHSDPSDPPLFDTAEKYDSYAQSLHFEDELGKEVGLLIRCNQSPDSLNIREQRKAPPLLEEQKYDPSQLVTPIGQSKYEMTQFFKAAVGTIFKAHSTVDGATGEKILDATCVAKWMSQALGESVGQHSKDVRRTISRYASYKTGRLTEANFQTLYFDAVLQGLGAETTTKTLHPRRAREKTNTLKNVWRDLEAHNILLPAVIAHAELKREIEGDENSDVEAKDGHHDIETLMDECEILSWGSERSQEEVKWKSSYEKVELASDNKTPKHLRDGSFVFIDEESCIGCIQCAQVAPSTFTMLENGRARTFTQNDTPEVSEAVSTCPVNCMHQMSFEELKEMEIARDNGDGRDDHQHMGRRQGHTPLHVSGIGSDANHKSSWYHYLKHKCYISKSCPQRGCFDCPMFSTPGENPNFQIKQKLADKVRIRDMMNSGELDVYRNYVDL